MNAAAETQAEPATVVTAEQKAAKKAPKQAHKRRRKAGVAAPKSKPAKKASRPKKGASAESNAPASRSGSKTAQILDLLGRESGATLADLMSATEWQPHSVRAFLSTLRKRRNVISSKGDDGARSYTIPK